MAGIGVGFLIGYSLSAAVMVFRSTRAGEMDPKPLGYFIAGTSIWIAYALYRYSQGLKPTEFAAPVYFPHEDPEDEDPDMATPIVDKVMDIQMMLDAAAVDTAMEEMRQELLLRYLQEYGPIVRKSKKKDVRKRLKGFEANYGIHGPSGNFPYDPMKKSKHIAAKNEWYTVIAYQTPMYDGKVVLADRVPVMEAISIFKAACDDPKYFTAEVYRNRRPPTHMEHFIKPQMELVLKCKYDYITGNDRKFLGFVKGSFDPKWRFQAEDNGRRCLGFNKQGNPCRAPSEYVWPNGYCQHHGPNATKTTAPLVVTQPDPELPTVVLENRDMLYEPVATAGGRQRDRLMEQPEFDDDDSAYDEWAKENVPPRVDSPGTIPPWAESAYESLYGTKWWDIGWVRDGETPVEDGPENVEDNWRDELPWYWGEMSPEEADFVMKNPILDATKPRPPRTKKLTPESRKLIERLSDLGIEDAE